MSAHPAATPAGGSAASSSDLGAKLVALAGVGLIGYGVMFLVRNFTGFIELGLTPERIGGTPDQIRAFSPHLYHYISHLQTALAAFIIGLGVAVIPPGRNVGGCGRRPPNKAPISWAFRRIASAWM